MPFNYIFELIGSKRKLCSCTVNESWYNNCTSLHDNNIIKIFICNCIQVTRVKSTSFDLLLQYSHSTLHSYSLPLASRPCFLPLYPRFRNICMWHHCLRCCVCVRRRRQISTVSAPRAIRAHLLLLLKLLVSSLWRWRPSKLCLVSRVAHLSVFMLRHLPLRYLYIYWT